MKAEVTVEAGGDVIRLALPIGGLEQIAEKFPIMEELLRALSQPVDGVRYYRFDEVRTVLAAGLKWGEAKMTAGALIEEIGVGPAASLAAKLLAAALRVDLPGKSPAAMKESATSVS